MAPHSVNRAAITSVRALIDEGSYVLKSDWGEVQPSADTENAYLEHHSRTEYGGWHLGLTEGATKQTKGRYAFVVGDFRQVQPQRTDRRRVPRCRVASQGRGTGRAAPVAVSGHGESIDDDARPASSIVRRLRLHSRSSRPALRRPAGTAGIRGRQRARRGRRGRADRR